MDPPHWPLPSFWTHLIYLPHLALASASGVLPCFSTGCATIIAWIFRLPRVCAWQSALVCYHLWNIKFFIRVAPVVSNSRVFVQNVAKYQVLFHHHFAIRHSSHIFHCNGPRAQSIPKWIHNNLSLCFFGHKMSLQKNTIYWKVTIYINLDDWYMPGYAHDMSCSFSRGFKAWICTFYLNGGNWRAIYIVLYISMI